MKPYEKMNSQNTALVVIDIVNGCCHEQCEDGNLKFGKIRSMVPGLISFIKQFTIPPIPRGFPKNSMKYSRKRTTLW